MSGQAGSIAGALRGGGKDSGRVSRRYEDKMNVYSSVAIGM